MPSITERTSLLRAAGIGYRLDDQALRSLAAETDVCDVGEGEVLIADDAPWRQSFVVVEGEAEVRRQGAEPEVAGPGTFLDAVAAGDRPVRAVARTPMVLLVIAPSVVARLRRAATP